MPGENLTRIEAQERAALVRTRSYDVDLDLTTGPEIFRSHHDGAVHAPRPAPPPSSTRSPATVHSVTLNGAELDPAEVSDGVRIQLDGLAAENELTVVADALYTNTGEGLHRFVDPVDGEVYLYTQFEVPDSPPRVRGVRAARPEGRRSRSPSPRPRTGQVVCNSPTPEPDATPATARRPGRSSPPRASPPTSPR